MSSIVTAPTCEAVLEGYVVKGLGPTGRRTVPAIVARCDRRPGHLGSHLGVTCAGELVSWTDPLELTEGGAS